MHACMSRTDQELQQETWEQRVALQRFGAMYDQGDHWAAKHLATVVSTLVREGKRNTHPLLAQIGVASSMPFLSTARQIAWNVKPNVPLLVMFSGPHGIRFIPRKDAPPDPENTRWLSFTEWWKEEPIFGEDSGPPEPSSGVTEERERRLTREALVKSIRDQDGGAHVDPVLSDATYELLKHGQVGVEVHRGGRQIPVEGAQLATMRQIAWEMEQSMGRHLGPGPAPRPRS